MCAPTKAVAFGYVPASASIFRRLRQRARALLPPAAALPPQALAHRQRVAVHAPVVAHAEGEHAGDVVAGFLVAAGLRSEEHTSELQSLMRTSYAVFCLKPKQDNKPNHTRTP